MFKNKILLVTGGTGSFGNAVLDKFIDSNIGEVRIFSRDEKKQDDMRRKFQNDKIKYFIGDVRNENSIDQAMVGVDYVFHAAALKQVPSCEFYPMEAVQTNIIGTENMLNSAIKNEVQSGLGASFVSISAISKELELGLLHCAKIEDLTIKRTLSIIINPHKYTSKASEKFSTEILTLFSSPSD